MLATPCWKPGVYGERDQDALRDAVAAGRQEYDTAFALVGGGVDGLLDGGGVVRLAVALGAHHDGVRVLGHGLESRYGSGGCGCGKREREHQRRWKR
jgi:hypothetical protein